MRKVIAYLLSVTILSVLGSLIAPMPASAVVYGSIKIGISQYSVQDPMYVYDVNNGQIVNDWWVSNDPNFAPQTTPWLYPVGIRVDTVVYDGGSSSSFRWKINGTGASGDWGACHTSRQDTIPPRSENGHSWTIWIKTYRNSNCTN